MTVADLMQALQNCDPQTEVVLEQRIKEGYDTGTIYESVNIGVIYKPSKVLLCAGGVKVVGGW